MKNFFAGVFGGKKEKVGPDKSIRNSVIPFVITYGLSTMYAFKTRCWLDPGT